MPNCMPPRKLKDSGAARERKPERGLLLEVLFQRISCPLAQRGKSQQVYVLREPQIVHVHMAGKGTKHGNFERSRLVAEERGR